MYLWIRAGTRFCATLHSARVNFFLYIFLSHSLLVGLLVNMSSLDGKDFLQVRGNAQ